MGINVGITGLHATDNPAPGIGVIRSLKHPEGWDGEIIGLAYDVMDTGVYDENLLDHAYMIPYPNSGTQQILARLLYIHSKTRLDVIIPTLDSELALFQHLEPELRKHGISLFLPDSVATKRISKPNIANFCKELEIDTPKTYAVKDSGELDKAIKEIGYPLMVKGAFYEAHKCRDDKDTINYFNEMRQKWGYPVILQQMIDADEYDVCCVGDGKGGMLGALPIRKTRITDKGKAWAAITLKNDQLFDLSKKIIRDLKWTGPCEIEILQEKNTAKMHLLEINPRFPAWIFLGTGANQNLPKMVVDLALGKDVQPLPNAKSGVTFVRHATDLICPIEWLEKLTTGGELHY